jgi:hypothetical protein
MIRLHIQGGSRYIKLSKSRVISLTITIHSHTMYKRRYKQDKQMNGLDWSIQKDVQNPYK